MFLARDCSNRPMTWAGDSIPLKRGQSPRSFLHPSNKMRAFYPVLLQLMMTNSSSSGDQIPRVLKTEQCSQETLPLNTRHLCIFCVPQMIVSSPRVEPLVQCLCLEEYTGTYCETPMNRCENSPCQNGGHCVSQSGADFVCACPNNWKGLFCLSPLVTVNVPSPLQE